MGAPFFNKLRKEGKIMKLTRAMIEELRQAIKKTAALKKQSSKSTKRSKRDIQKNDK